MVPGNDVGIRIDTEGRAHFSGETTEAQQFMQDNFAESVYQYLPKFGFNPNQPDNPEVIRRIDSLQEARRVPSQAYPILLLLRVLTQEG